MNIKLRFVNMKLRFMNMKLRFVNMKLRFQHDHELYCHPRVLLSGIRFFPFIRPYPSTKAVLGDRTFRG